MITIPDKPRHEKNQSIDINRYLASWGEKNVIYCPNPGNAGDSAIAESTYQIFDTHGISWKCVSWDSDDDLSGQFVIYGGGGNLINHYSHASTFIRRHHSAARRFVIFPHTVQGHQELIQSLGPNVDIICREKVSFAYVKHQAREARVLLADDLALHLDWESILAEPAPSWVSLATRSAVRYATGRQKDDGIPPLRRFSDCVRDLTFHRLRLRSRFSRGQRVLRAFRTDREQTSIKIPYDNIDLSKTFSFGTTPRERAKLSTIALLRFINAYDAVVTNRLHICVLAALIGKRVDFYANSYYKNRAVYELSLAERFPQVEWHDSPFTHSA